MKEIIPISEPYIAKNQIEYVNDCLRTNWISSLGKYLGMFEEKFSDYIGCDYGICTSNGTTALHLALSSLGIGPKDEVIVPDLTFVATANSVTYNGAKPVFVDVSEKDWCIDADLIEEKITKHTRAIIPVHLYGNVCDMNKISSIAKKYNLFVVEDVAEAIGAEYNGKKAGSFSDVSCFSFYGNKIITTGEGGMCLTNNQEIKAKIELLKDHGMSKTQRYYHLIRGFNYRMTNIQAAIGLAQLEEIGSIIKKRDRIAEEYESLLKNKEGIRLAASSKLARSICWLFSIVLEDNFKKSREDLIEYLKKNGVDTRPFFYPMHRLPYFKDEYQYRVSDILSEKGLNLPTFTNLSNEQINRICNLILSA